MVVDVVKGFGPGKAGLEKQHSDESQKDSVKQTIIYSLESPRLSDMERKAFARFK